MGMLVVFFVSICLVFFVCERIVVKSYEADEFFVTNKADVVVPANALMVNLTLILGSSDRKAVCLDGTPPGYYLNAGFGSGANSWLIQLEGGGWCNTVKNCIYRKTSRHGSSKFFEKAIQFIGILGNNSKENPDFYNWNRVKVRYCDGASFAGDSENTTAGLQFRGRRVWRAVMKQLMSKGMHNANQALLSGCSAGGLASILHCDNFRSLFRKTTKVKCLSDAGLFIDAADVSGRRRMREFFIQVVRLHGVPRNAAGSCPSHMDRASCFFPQNLIANIKTPLFILNAAYDSWQIQESLVPKTADVNGTWNLCKSNYKKCSKRQMDFFYGFRKQMLNVTKGFAASKKNGVYINSCFAHCQSEREDTWYSKHSPTIKHKRIAEAVGYWYKYGMHIEAIEGESCGPTCHNLVFR